MIKAIVIMLTCISVSYSAQQQQSSELATDQAQVASGDYSNVCSTCPIMGVYDSNGTKLAGDNATPLSSFSQPVQSEGPLN